MARSVPPTHAATAHAAAAAGQDAGAPATPIGTDTDNGAAGTAPAAVGSDSLTDTPAAVRWETDAAPADLRTTGARSAEVHPRVGQRHHEQQDEEAPARKEPRARREEILDGAAELFAEFGYYGASLRDISGRVGISHPGMLHHFASKEELLGGVIDRLEDHAQDALDRQDEICADPDTFLRALVTVWHPDTHSMQLMATLDGDSVSETHPGHFRMARLRRVHEHVLEHCFTMLAEQDMLRGGVEPAFASRAMLSLILRDAVRERTVRTMQGDDHDDAPQKDLREMIQIFLRD